MQRIRRAAVWGCAVPGGQLSLDQPDIDLLERSLERRLIVKGQWKPRDRRRQAVAAQLNVEGQ